ncbi:hypothetical protein AAHE18_17G240800 [Arachis hypogaea]
MIMMMVMMLKWLMLKKESWWNLIPGILWDKVKLEVPMKQMKTLITRTTGLELKRKGIRERRKLQGPTRFVIDVCRRLKEKKQYMVYTAVGCLGISALSDLVKEVDAIQACGGQKTADGSRFRTGGGILWNIIKVREPKVYKEIMKKVKEFEKQFRQPYVKQPPVPKKIDPSEGINLPFADRDEGNVLGSAFPASQMQDQHEPAATSEAKPIPVIHDRLRTPVSYDDDLLGEDPEKDAT